MAFTKEEANYLVDYYCPKLIGKRIKNVKPKWLTIDFCEIRQVDDQKYRVLFFAKAGSMAKPYFDLYEIADRKNLESPDDVLSRWRSSLHTKV